jgi:hypothetical protein
LKDPIVTIALAGTSRQEHVKIVTGTPVDALLAGLPEGEVERAFLLGAGTWAVYRQAGTKVQQNSEIYTPAGEEILRECSPKAALLIERLLANAEGTLLLEALKRMRQQKLRLPHRLLPLLLNAASTKELRTAIFPLLGERGRWLSQFNTSWKWVDNYLASDEDGLPADAETIWQEGTLGQRVGVLRLLRVADPSKALAWLEAVWKQEKAEPRLDLINTLEVGLSASDESFLEKVLDDKSRGVRDRAVELLTRLPASALNARMRLRGQNMLQMIQGHIRIALPAELETSWQRDGIVEKPLARISKRGWWLTQVLATIEPGFWETHLGASPTELLNLLPAHDEWKMQIIEGWSQAARKFRTPNWLEPLWSWWHEHYQETIDLGTPIEYGYCMELLQDMPASTAGRLMLGLIEKNHGNLPGEWSIFQPNLPRPWSVEFSQAYLQSWHAYLSPEKMLAETLNPYLDGDSWLWNVEDVALSLPKDCFAEALQPWNFPDGSSPHIEYARRQIQRFTETIQIRKNINEEII